MKRLLSLFTGTHQPDAGALSAYLDGELRPAERARLDEHLESCAACSARLAELRSIRSALAAMPAAEPRRSFRLRESDVRQPVPSRVPAPPSFLMRTMPALSAAAALAFVIALAVDVRGDEGASENGASARITTDGAPLPEDSGNQYDAGADEAPANRDGAPTLEDGDAAGESASSPTRTPPAAGLAPGAGARPNPDKADSDNDDAEAQDRVQSLNDDGDEGNNSTVRFVEVIAGIIAVAAGAIALTAWLRRRGVTT